MNGATSSLLFIHAQTSLHPGSGTASGAIDLPVQRERHTGWPLIPGSTIKGVLRDYCRLRIQKENMDKDLAWADRDPALECVFGPSVKGVDGESSRGSNPNDFAGALAVMDARILFFPVRSLCGLFAWVTCSAALDRLCRDVEIISGKKDNTVPAISVENEKDAKVVSNKLLVPNSTDATGSSNMVLEEFDFKAEGTDQSLQTFVKRISEMLDLDRFTTHLAVISDDMFAHFVKNATEVNARIALEYETKTVKDGALFYVETLPPETVFYSLLIADRPRGGRSRDGKPEKPALGNADDVLEYINSQLKSADDLPAVLQIGGEASTGKGLCRVILHDGSAL